MGDFVGTNCRINTYALLKNSIEIPPIEKDDTLLFIDNDAIDKGKLFSSEDKEALNRLFSRVKTEATTDVKVHAAKMEQFLSQFKFNENARMLSVVIHDNLDGYGLALNDKNGIDHKVYRLEPHTLFSVQVHQINVLHLNQNQL